MGPHARRTQQARRPPVSASPACRPCRSHAARSTWAAEAPPRPRRPPALGRTSPRRLRSTWDERPLPPASRHHSTEPLPRRTTARSPRRRREGVSTVLDDATARLGPLVRTAPAPSPPPTTAATRADSL